MERESFSFFRSFYEQLIKIKDKDPDSANALLWAIVNYGMTREEPTFDDNEFIADVAWINLKIVLDSGWAKYENGAKPKRKKAKQKQNKSEKEANEKQSESETEENKNKKEKENKKEDKNIREKNKEKDIIKTEFDELSSSYENDFSTLSNEVWSEQVMMTLHMLPEQYREKVVEFQAEQKIRGTRHTDDQELRQHFYSWLKIQNNGNSNRLYQAETPRERSIRENEEATRRERERLLANQG